MKNYISIDNSTDPQVRYFYISFFRLHKIDAIYTEVDSITDIKNIREYDGIIIGRPFKQEAMKYLDSVDQSASIYNACNSIVVKNNQLTGFNSDLAGAIHVAKYIGKKDDIAILGNGCMGKMFEKFLGMTESRKITTYSRSLGNWDQRHQKNSVVINCTTVGSNSDNSPLDTIPAGTSVVVDLQTSSNKLKNQCTEQNVKYVSGRDFYKYQFMMQYRLLTGITIDPLEYDTI